MEKDTSQNQLRTKLHEIIFEADTPAGKVFDVLLMISILASVVMVMLDSVGSIQQSYGDFLYIGEHTESVRWLAVALIMAMSPHFLAAAIRAVNFFALAEFKEMFYNAPPG